MDRVNQLRSEVPESLKDSSLDNSQSGDHYVTANDVSSKYFSLSDADSTLEGASVKKASPTQTDIEPVDNISDSGTNTLISSLSPISQKSDNFVIGKQIEAANILSGGVDIFDNDNSYDGDELVIDDNVTLDTVEEKSNIEERQINQPNNTSENKVHINTENPLLDSESTIPSKNTEVILQIDGKNVDAIDIGNGLYLYRKDGEDKELAAVQILDVNQQQPSFKFLKVRENAEGNLEVYEEFVEMHKGSPENDENTSEKGICHVPIKDINEVINDHSPSKVTEMKIKQKESSGSVNASNEKEISESKNEANMNSKTVKISDNSRKSPLIGSFTPMAFHSTPNKEGIPLTKTMVDMQLHPNRHNDSTKKTIEVNTDNCRQKSNESVSVDSKEVQKDFKINSKEHCKISQENTKHITQAEKQCVGAETSECSKIEDLDSRTVSSKELQISPKNEQRNVHEKILNSEYVKINDLKGKKSSDIKELAVIVSDENNSNVSLKSKNDVEISDKKTSTLLKSLDRKIINEQPNKNTDVLNSIMVTPKSCQTLNTADNLCVKDVENHCKKEKITSMTKVREPEILPCVDNDIKIENKDKIKRESCNVKSKLENYDDSSNSLINNKLNLKNVLESGDLHAKTRNVNNTIIKIESEKNNDLQKKKILMEKPKPLNNNIPVPFGKWTEANKQEYLNKIKESKVPSLSGSTNQIKQPKDLNRRDVLNKIDIARHTLLTKDSFNSVKSTVKSEVVKQIKPIVSVRENKTLSADTTPKIQTDHTVTSIKKSESANRTEINNQDLIDKTIEGILMDKIITSKVSQDNDMKPNVGDKTVSDKTLNINFDNKYGIEQQTSILDDIERQLNELHGQPNKQRVNQGVMDSKISNIQNNEVANVKVVSNKIPSLVPLSGSIVTKQTLSKDLGEYSDEEILECEPVTGDIELDQRIGTSVSPIVTKVKVDTFNEESGNVITEKDFEKFARRNSVTYENCITVNFTAKQQTNLIQNVIPKDMTVKKDLNDTEVKSKSQFKPLTLEDRNKIDSETKFPTKDMDVHNSNNPKSREDHRTSLNVKRQKESPITVIEDKPVKVVFVDSATEFQPYQLNAQGQQLSSNKHKDIFDCDSYTVSSCDSLDSDILEARDDKGHEEIKVKAKHQRKQVLTPVDIPDMELIEPKDLGIETKHKRKRKTEDSKRHLETNDDQPAGKKNAKNLVPKKSYLLGRTIQVKDREYTSKLSRVTNSEENSLNIDKEPFKENNTCNTNDTNCLYHHNVSNPIDNLVKAAELLEKQTENNQLVTHLETSSDSSLQPIKRGRGRPRKYPVQDTEKYKVSSPQKKLKLTEVVVSKTETSDEDNDEEGIARENWTMGKINEKIICPICNKLFRSENVVFKHVKHCSGSSPIKGDSPERKSPKFDDQSYKNQDENSSTIDQKEATIDQFKKSTQETIIDEDVIVIEDSFHNDSFDMSPIRSSIKSETKDAIDTCNINRQLDSTSTKHPSQTGVYQIKRNTQQRPAVTNIICEICGKTFRQLSYLVNHKLLHKKSEIKKSDSPTVGSQTTFSCEVCKKDFRKLHHLVQHRFNHNPSTSKIRRKSSIEQNEQKLIDSDSKATEDQGAGFRCEPCDKSFRKLHHLVEHREKHDNKIKSKNISSCQNNIDKNPASPPQCDICNKTFRKLHHMIEHKEQHLEAKNCEKTNNAVLIARDIIHECSLCYMVFPNEHALNKHFIICQRKKKSAKLKKDEKKDGMPGLETENVSKETSTNVSLNSELVDNSEVVFDKTETFIEKCFSDNGIDTEQADYVDKNYTESIPLDESAEAHNVNEIKEDNNALVITEKIIDTKTLQTEKTNTFENISEKKTPLRDKMSLTVTKPKRTSRTSIAESTVVINDASDSDEDIRYMFNPNYKANETVKKFMKVRANRRNSLVCGSTKLVTRRTSTRYSPKVHGNKMTEKLKNGTCQTSLNLKSMVRTSPKKKNTVPLANADSSADENEIKYSFPKPIKTRKSMKAKTPETRVTNVEKRNSKTVKSVIEKPKILGNNLKKTLGRTVINDKPSSTKQEVKRRVKEVGHRCDCGQLFNSAALLARHTTLMHTPPRRRRLSPPPQPTSPTIRASALAFGTTPKPRRNGAHRGIPITEKMKKNKDKLK